MTDFTPEHYLAAARIAYPEHTGETWNCDGRGHPWLQLRNGAMNKVFEPENNGNDYRALREALDKRGHYLRWDGYNEEWISTEFDFIGDRIRDVNPVNAMMKIVVALVEVGVVE